MTTRHTAQARHLRGGARQSAWMEATGVTTAHGVTVAKERVTFTVPRDTAEALRDLAVASARPLSELVGAILADYLRQSPPAASRGDQMAPRSGRPRRQLRG